MLQYEKNPDSQFKIGVSHKHVSDMLRNFSGNIIEIT
jgi:hypothetical protein